MATLLDWLKRTYPDASNRTLKQMVEDGRVMVNGRAARATNVELADGDAVLVGRRARAEPNVPGLEPLRVIHEDDDVLVVEKPAGLLTSTTPREPRPTAIKIVTEHLRARDRKLKPGLIHRLDKDASGVLVFTKNAAAFESLKKQFFRHDVTRRYRAVVHGKPASASGRIESRLVERADGTMRSTRPDEPAETGEHAVTNWSLVSTHGRFSLVEVQLETGRKHQIRAHLSELGHPIAGDRWYGSDAQRAIKAPRLLLAAVHLAFDHPRDGRRVSFESPAPGEFAAFLAGRPSR